MGLTIDKGIGTYLDRAAHILRAQLHQVRDDDKIARFVRKFNKTHDSPFSQNSEPLTEEALSTILSDPYAHGGALLEKLAALGDPSVVPFPIPLPNSRTADVSFAGIETYLKKNVFGGKISKPSFEMDARAFDSVEDLVDLAASAQFAAFC
mmetsp:Transcript_17823/g.21012  ORF Transcript_17823/g.21012 Transcript_17823/m.21012 type:complete len:151 (-) Transcript_17823:303-755(-)